MAMMPTTDLIELGGIPFRHTGAKTSDMRGGVEYALNARNSLSASVNRQVINFDRPEEVRAFRERLAGDGIEIAEFADEPEYVSVKCKDPDGYVIELAWEPDD